MRKVVLIASLYMVTSLTANADILPCETLKANVDARLQAKGVPSYTLEIVPIETNKVVAGSGVPETSKPSGKGKVVGTCEGGTKQLIYTRGF